VYYLYLARELNKPARARKRVKSSRGELAFWLIKITSQAELAHYQNEPSQVARYPALLVPRSCDGSNYNTVMFSICEGIM
jgi:hypothetical protein